MELCSAENLADSYENWEISGHVSVRRRMIVLVMNSGPRKVISFLTIAVAVMMERFLILKGRYMPLRMSARKHLTLVLPIKMEMYIERLICHSIVTIILQIVICPCLLVMRWKIFC